MFVEENLIVFKFMQQENQLFHHEFIAKPLLQFMVFSIGFSNLKMPKSDKYKKNHLINVDKSFCTCLAPLGSQIGPCHFDWWSD